MKSSVLPLVAFSFCLLACSKVKKLDDMAAATDNMESTTKQMARNTGHTDIMYRQMRAKEAAATRLQEYSNLLSKEVLTESKCSSAGIYFMSQEFQLATEEEVLRKEDIMASLKKAAANDFIRKLGDLHSKIDLDDLDPTKKLKGRNDEAVFNALAATIHFNNEHQEFLAKLHRIPTVSLYDLVKNALRKDKMEMDARSAGRGVDHGVHYEEYEQILMTGKRKQMLIELLKARVDMLAAIALHHMSDKSQMSLDQMLDSMTFLVSQGHFGKINIPMTIAEANTATKNTVIETLDGALKAKRFLENELGIEKNLVKTLKSAYKQINLEGDRELEKLQARINELRD